MDRLRVAAVLVVLLSVGVAGCSGIAPSEEDPSTGAPDSTTPAEGTLEVHSGNSAEANEFTRGWKRVSLIAHV